MDILTLSQAAARLEAWLESMRGPDGYGGPVVHWWRDSLLYTAAGLDWRYEGILAAYLLLFQRTGNRHWLNKARRAGDDLLAGQQTDGRFRASSFEANPRAGGTPHEAACDLGLLRLASMMKAESLPGWESYAEAAIRNLQDYYLASLWNPTSAWFQNLPGDSAFVPNKSATLVEALFEWLLLDGDEALLHHYIYPTLDAILDCQLRQPGSSLDGAIDQSRAGLHPQGRYFPYYIARCLPALLRGYEVRGYPPYLEAALAAARFILRCQHPPGCFPQLVYANGEICPYPRWVAGCGDIVRAFLLLQPYGLPVDLEPMIQWILRGQTPAGGINTASGFGQLGLFGSRESPPDFRDLLPVCGWVDKTFYALLLLGAQITDTNPPALEMWETACHYNGQPAILRETSQEISISQGQVINYRWRKGAAWAEAL